MKKTQSKNFIKKILIFVLIMVCGVLFMPNFNHIRAENENVEEIIFNENIDNISIVNSSNFTVSFSSVTSSTSDGVLFNTDNVISINQISNDKAISKIEFYSQNSNIFYNNTLSGGEIISYFNIQSDEYLKSNGVLSLSTSISSGSLEYVVVAEYINALVTNEFKKASFTSKEELVISKIKIYYEEYSSETDLTNYIILNLKDGFIKFEGNTSQDSYTYYITNNKTSTTPVSQATFNKSGSFDNNDQFYIIQSVIDEQGNNVRYNYPIDNYNISFNSRIICTMVFDNIWCSYCTTDGTEGGLHVPISAHSSDLYRKIVNIKLKGNNIFSRISYYTGGEVGFKTNPSKSALKFTSFYGDGSTEGNLIVIGKQRLKNNSTHGKLAENGWHSVIGGTDSNSRVTGLEFAGGTIIVVATAKDQCTAIGAGGNGAAEIKITGGSVTAISATTGTAIGGGIGHNSKGGVAQITITGGIVNAYNMGQPYKLTFESNKTLNIADFVPGTAIGSGSSYLSIGESSEINISGGIVNAYSNGGSGLGGGNSIVATGGSSTINITGGQVKSYGYIPNEDATKIKEILNNLQTNVLDVVPNGNKIIESTKTPYDYGKVGAGIGGGSGQDKAGGSATINISGGFLDASSIGGGNSVYGDGAYAKVNVTGGTTKCGTIGGGYSETYGYADGSVTVTGGSLNATMSAIPTNGKSSDMLFLTRISVLDSDNNIIANQRLTSLTTNGLDISAYTDGLYGINSTYTDNDGMLYLWLPKNSAVLEGAISINDNTPIIVSPFEEADNMISAYEIGILKETENSTYNHYINTVSSDFYSLYRNYNIETGELSTEVANTTIVSNNSLFTMYIKLHGDYEINAYYGVESSTGRKTFQLGTVEKVLDKFGNTISDIYTMSITITQNTLIVFSVKAKGSDEYYFVLDLYEGNINVTEGETGYIIEQNGYELTGFSGGLYVTSGGVATPNNINITINDNSEFDLFMNNIIIGSTQPCISVNSGIVTLETDDDNDIIQSNSSSAIFIDENAKLIINANGSDALQISTTNKDVSAISGKGTLVFNNLGGHYEINNASGSIKPQISVGIYEFSGNNEFNAELFIDEFEFQLIGYIDKDKKLNGVDVSQSGNTESYAARGVYKVLTNVKSTSDKVQNGNYITTLEIDSPDTNALIGTVEVIPQYDYVSIVELSVSGNISTYTITYKNGETSNYTVTMSNDKKSCTVEVEGRAFLEGNIMVFGAAEGDIPHQIISYNGKYDALPHSITIAVNETNFSVYYSQYVMLTESNYLTEGSLVCPTFTDVTKEEPGYVTVYVFIILKPGASTVPYDPISTSGTVTITKGENEWTKNLTCSDIPYKENVDITPSPNALAKWGYVNYKYYDKDGNELIGDFKFEKGKTYQVSAYVIGNDNYDTIETNYTIKFRVVELKVFTSDYRNLSMALGTNSTIQITPNGSFTVLYQITYSANLSLKLINNKESSINTLPEGTKITFIDFPTDGSGNPTYYYYYVKESDNIIVGGNSVFELSLTKFIKMGTNNELFIAPSDSKAVEYQFCIEFTKDNIDTSEISLTLSDSINSDYESILIKTSLINTVEEVTVKNPEVFTEESNEYELIVDIRANDSTTDKVLALELITDDITGLNISLYRANSTELIEYSDKIKGLYFFKLTSNKDVVDSKYRIVFSNNDLNEKEVDLLIDIRSTNNELPFVLEDQTYNNHQEIHNIRFKSHVMNQLIIRPIEKNNDRIITDQNESLIFDFITNIENLNEIDINVRLYKKNLNEYVYLNDLVLINSSINITNNLLNGTYRIEFEYNGIYNYCNFIVLRE